MDGLLAASTIAWASLASFLFVITNGVPRQALSHNRLVSTICALKLKSILGNINAQYARSSHFDLPSQVKVLQIEG